ncbi:hypothetical protein MGI18_13840 [Bacillus sp. OVS6]|nr:hypothetical protein MGI18_13840 [Bacillus sp. OVS6]
MEGIIYDLVYSNKSMSENNEEVLTNWYYDYARYMMNHKESILYFLYSLEKQPVSNLISSNNVSTIQGRINKKSFQWDQTSRGLSKNSGNNTGQTYFYNRIKKINYNLKSNQWIKNILLIWSTEINHVIEVISNSHLNVQKEINSLKQQQVGIEERRTYLNQKRDVAKSEKIDLFVKIKNLEKNIQDNIKIATQQDNWIIQIRSIYSRMIHLLNNSFLEEVDRGIGKPVLKSNSYYQINTLYENSKKIQKDNGDKQRYIKILKPFWQIYEYFCLFTVIDSLRKIGYKVTSGFEQSFVELYHQSMIPPNTLIRLESDNAVIDCWYDKYHGNIFTAQQNNELFYTTQEKKRPDIKLDLYEKQEDGSLLFKNCLIFDAKFRKLANMHNNDYETTTYEQLTSYYSFFYLGKNRKSGRGNVVEQVICLYGSEKTEAIKKVVDPLLYIKLFPIIQEDNEVQIKGEKELLEEIETWLDDLIPVLHI